MVDKAHKTTPLTTTVDVIVDEAFMGGLRGGWMKGGDGEVSFDMSSGDGLANPYLYLVLTKGEHTSHEAIDMRAFLKAWLSEARARLEFRIERDA